MGVDTSLKRVRLYVFAATGLFVASRTEASTSAHRADVLDAKTLFLWLF
jgi:hypothetical protein